MSYTTKSNDIAAAHGIPLNALLAASPFTNPSTLQVISLVPSTPTLNHATASPSSRAIIPDYVNSSNPTSNFPSPNQRVSHSHLQKVKSKEMKYNDTDSEVAFIHSAIKTESSIDVRAILCMYHARILWGLPRRRHRRRRDGSGIGTEL